MITTTDKRKYIRHDCNARIKWRRFNLAEFSYGQEIFYHARALNFSECGLYFENKYPLKPGVTILYRVEVSDCDASNLEGCSCLRTISLAEVKWCRDLVNDGESYFGIGARYPIYY